MVKFDVVIGNPPYQENDNDAGKGSGSPLYHHFIESVVQIDPELVCLITPSVWFTGGKGLNAFRKKMLTDKHIKVIHNYEHSREVFPSVALRGGVSYFIRDINYNNEDEGVLFENEKSGHVERGKRRYVIEGLDLFISNNHGMTILEKLTAQKSISYDMENPLNMSYYVSARNPFGFDTRFWKSDEFHSNPNMLNEPIKIYAAGGRTGYVERDLIAKNKQLIDRVKVITAFANNIGTDARDDNLNSIIADKKSIVTETYLIVGDTLIDSIYEASNLKKYLTTKFVRCLIGLAKANQNGTRKVYRFVPIQDFTKGSDIDWTKSIKEIDQQLYEKYGLSEEEITFIETRVKEMD